jgi:hemin uptake protein HemP
MTQHDKDTSQQQVDRKTMTSGTDPSVTIIDARTLFGSAREIGIEHEGALYRLKITRQGKLILNK